MEGQWAASPRAHRLLRLAADGQGDRSAVLAKVALERQITPIWVVAAVHRKRAGRVPNGGYLRLQRRVTGPGGDGEFLMWAGYGLSVMMRS
jgi:hypothetical protein